jgi:F0F1-type ATP synthase epsilon subunit
VNFDYSDDQKFLKNEARKFLDAHSTSAAVRVVLNDDAVSYDKALWKGVAEQGWLGAAIPEEFGGLGLGHVELCAIAEELGRSVAPIPFASTVYFVAEALMLAGNDAQKADLLPKIAAGEITARKGGQDYFLAIGEGFVEVTGSRVAVLTDMAIKADDIDEARAEEARKRAEARLAEKLTDEEAATVQASLMHSLTQLNVKRRRRI